MSGVGAVAVAHIQIGVNQSAVVVDVEACVGTAASVATCLHRAVIASLAVFLEYNVDDTSRTFSREFSRRIVNHFYTVDAFSRQLLQNLCAVVRSQSRRLAINPYLNARIATQRHIAVVVNLDRRHIVEHVRSRLSGIADELADIKRLAVYLQLHCCALSRHGHLIQLLGILSHIQQLELHLTLSGSNLKLTCHVSIAHKSKRQRVLAVL